MTQDLKDKIAKALKPALDNEALRLSYDAIDLLADHAAQAVIDALGVGKPVAGIDYVTVRGTVDDFGDDAFDLECRFTDGQKYAAVKVCGEQEDLAHAICNFLNGAKQ